MATNLFRRDVLRTLALGSLLARAGSLLAGEAPAGGNFRYIYTDPARREEFRKFLVNVFRLYPEDDLHALIHQSVQQGRSDREIYGQVQARLDSIKPLLGDLRYSLPTLNKQKRVLTAQTVALIDRDRRYEGYLEVGSNGRFLDGLEEELDLAGERFYMAERAPTNSVIDILDRGQLTKGGSFINLDAYRPKLAATIPPRSIDLITVYIGFHHCPLPLRQEFLGQLRTVLRPGGVLIVRDHNARDEGMLRMVGLAHDVFNMGTGESWQYNERELRNFYSLATLDQMLTAAGFRAEGKRLLQPGDPTINTLMKYVRA